MSKEKSKILIVDDVESNVEFVTDILKLGNLEFLTAYNGKDALKVVKEKEPDLILLDISMPGMDGYEVCEKLKADKSTKDIPIIFLTARVQQEDIKRGFELGAVDYVVKPFSYNELNSRIKTHIDLREKSKKLESINDELESIISKRTLELKLTNDELQRTNKKLLEANKRLEKFDKSKNEFVLHINHELRTPLNGILGQVNFLKESLQEKNNLDIVNSIEMLTKRLTKLSELSLLFTELKVSESKVEMTKLNLINSLNTAIQQCNLNEKNIEIKTEKPYSKITLLSEKKLLESCLTIVIDNAIKYSPDNDFIEIILKKTGDSVIINVIDNGPGFSDKALENLFEFFSADNLDHNSYGFGVGLATAKIIMDIMDGEIKIANKQPNGAEVMLIFKLEENPE